MKSKTKIPAYETEVDHCNHQIKRLNSEIEFYQTTLNRINHLKSNLEEVRKVYLSIIITTRTPKEWVYYLNPKYVKDTSLIHYEPVDCRNWTNYNFAEYIVLNNNKIYLDKSPQYFIEYSRDGNHRVNPKVDLFIEKYDGKDKSKIIKGFLNLINEHYKKEIILTPKIKTLINFQ